MGQMKRAALRAIPAVEKVVQALGALPVPRPMVVNLVRRELAQLRKTGKVTSFDEVMEQVKRAVDVLAKSRIQPVINGTGVVIHTNLGRSPLSAEALAEVESTAMGYSNLEFDLSDGRRGSRGVYLEEGLANLCRSEAASVVNNCAAALVLVLRHFTAKKREVVISRGELIQIGGGFRIPEILEASGATLREVGTTNKTSLADYRKALGPETGLVLKVHRSNFFMGGFVESPSTEEIAALAKAKKVPFVEDLGSGAVVATEDVLSRSGGSESPHEPTPAEVLKRGADLVCFSGDKLLGGPQAGIVAGKRKHVQALKKEPFFRALRCDKLVLTALQVTVETYLDADGPPVLKMLGLSEGELTRRAKRLAKKLADCPIKVSVGRGQSQVGGGTMPEAKVDSITLDLVPRKGGLAALASRLRNAEIPVVGYVSGSRLKVDLRTVFPEQDASLMEAIRGAAAE